jgi:2-dehydropantoate 2-reductase
MFSEPIHILGGGSIGLLWAASIRSVFPSYPVQVLLRNTHKIIDDNQIAICLEQPQDTSAAVVGKHKKRRSRVVQVPAALVSSSQKPIRNLIVATKAYQALEALESIKDRLSTARVILLCNGALAVREQLKDLKCAKIHVAVTTHGAYRDTQQDDDELFHVVHAGQGLTLLQDYPAMAELWHMAGLNCQSVSAMELEDELWYKLAANCVINPLTALRQCPNGELLHKKEFDKHCHDILEEVAAVAEAVGQGHLTREMLHVYVRDVVAHTAHNQSSMLQDVLAKRPTEIHELNGYIVDMGRAHGIDCPVNQELVQQIKSL